MEYSAAGLWLDVAIVAGITVATFVFAAYFQFNEALYSLTRRQGIHPGPR